MTRLALWFTFAAEADASERNAVLGAFIALGDHLGHVTAFACGPGVDPQARTAGFGHAVSVVFETDAAWATYRALPGYAAALGRLAGTVEGGADGIRISTARDG